MNRAVQPGLMILAAAALVTVAVLLPVTILRPSGPAPKSPLAIETPARAPPVAEKSAAPPTESEEEGDLSRAQRFRMVEQETLKRLGPSALVSALARAFVFPPSRDDVIFGIDVSHHNQRNCQCDIDWARVAQQKVAFVVVKATEGTRFRDPHFRGHWEQLARVPEIHRGAYHFMSADDDPEEQANFFLAMMGPLRAVDMPPVLDLEWDVVVRSTRKWPKRDGDYWSQLTPNEILDRVLTWLDVVEKRTGRIPIVYTSRAWWDGRIKSDALLARLKRYPIWLSAMEEKDLQVERPGTRGGWAAKWNWTLWQFTNRGDLTRAGVRNPANPRLEGFDVNLFRGSLPEFRKAMGIVVPIVVADTQTKPVSGASAAAQEAAVAPAKEAVKPANQTPPEPPKGPASETPKEVAKEPIPEAPKEPPKGAGPPAVTPKEAKEAPTETPRETAKEPVPETPKEPPKSGTEVAVIPSDATKPTEPGSSGAGSEASGIVAATEPPKEAGSPAAAPKEEAGPPSEAAREAKEPTTEMPKEVAKEPMPEAPREPPKGETEVVVVPSDATKPTEPGSSGGGPDVSGTVAATEPPKEAGPPAVAPKEAKEAPTDTTPKSETQVAAVPDGDSGSIPRTNESDVVIAPPTTPEPKEEPAKENRVAGIPGPVARNPDGGTAPPNMQGTNSPAGAGRAADAASLPRTGAALSASVIEIVLANGRVLRVHADIDPQVLMRFVTLLEK
jgi:lysozyme